MLKRYVYTLAAGLCLVLGAGGQDDAKQELEKLQGTWKVVKFVLGGKQAPPDTIGQMSLVIKGNRMITMQGERNEGEGTFTLNPAKKPKEIDAVAQTKPDKGKKVVGIYEIEPGEKHDTLKLCVNDFDATERPREFASPPDSKMVLIILQREKKKPE
jgi:uncharacterized protein (TIGR03067 family)